MAKTEPPAILQFGDYTVHRRERSLRKHEHRLKLHGQSFEILLVLTDRPGEVVTREELQVALWKDDTFVDFENGLNAAVKKLRQVLGDSAESPRYIETVPRVGYRFLAPVVGIEPKENEGRETLPPSEESQRAVLSEAHRRFGLLLKILALLVPATAVVFGVLWINRTQVKPPLSAKDTIVLADFANSTGDSVFDGALRQGLAVQLEQSPFLSLASESEIQQTLRMMGQPTESRLTAEVAREVCQRTNSVAVLNGAISQIGTQYLLTVAAVNCSTGKTLASTEAQASDKNRVLDALGKTASEIREKLGESLTTVQRFDTDLQQATTPSLEALKTFSLGSKVVSTTGSAAAIPFYKRAIELDPNFALAYALLGRVYGDVGETVLAAESTQRAYELRDRTSEPEKYYISASYDIVVTGNMERAVQTCELWKQAYSRAEGPHDFLAGLIYPVLGQNEKAVEKGREAVHLFPNSPIPPSTLMFSYIATNRLNEANATYEAAINRKLDVPYFHIALYELAFLQDDSARMAQEVSWSAGKPGVEDELLDLEAHTAAYVGRLQKARELSRQAADSAERAGEHETAAIYLAVSGLREALYGNGEEAKRRVAQAMSRSTGRDLEYGAALALAYARDERRAEALAADLNKRFKEDILVRFNYLPTLKAKLAINRGNTSGAVESLRAAAAYELGESTTTPYSWYALYPAFVRGEAFLAARQGKEATAEFQKVLDQRGLVQNEPIGALAHLGLARAYVLQGDTARARTAYQYFLTLWKDADPDIPALKQAKAEYAKLQ